VSCGADESPSEYALRSVTNPVGEEDLFLSYVRHRTKDGTLDAPSPLRTSRQADGFASGNALHFGYGRLRSPCHCSRRWQCIAHGVGAFSYRVQAKSAVAGSTLSVHLRIDGADITNSRMQPISRRRTAPVALAADDTRLSGIRRISADPRISCAHAWLTTRGRYGSGQLAQAAPADQLRTRQDRDPRCKRAQGVILLVLSDGECGV
jgi:hypothetical protein